MPTDLDPDTNLRYTIYAFRDDPDSYGTVAKRLFLGHGFTFAQARDFKKTHRTHFVAYAAVLSTHHDRLR